ncbi:hypothetical protein [Streptomyces sp. MMG1121]|uniref:hypothetical protein n=1 Tax=Streptomyces sp. MMG1121 TaxID=1415544 RepID=UPI00131C21A0|nr:hypothetical protein [Streptomyces sp. MMG1121]
MPADTAATAATLGGLEARLKECAGGADTSVVKRHTAILHLDADVEKLENDPQLAPADQQRVAGLRRGVDQQKAAVEARARQLDRYLAKDGGPYTMMVENGLLWTDQYWPNAFAKMRERLNPSWWGEAAGQAYFEKMSRQNVAGMRQDTSKVQGDWKQRMRDGLQDQLRRSVLRHYTTLRRAELMLTGGMKTKADLEHSEFDYDHNTSAFDEHGLSNSGFLFFFIEDPAAPFRDTRFKKEADGTEGTPARITLGIQESGLLSKGWVMLSDFAQREYPTIMADENDPAQTDSFLPTREDERRHPEYQLLVRRFTPGRETLTEADVDTFMELSERDSTRGQAFSVVRPMVRNDASNAMTYGAGPQQQNYPEPLVRNILTGKDIIPGLAERAVLEVSRFEQTTPQLADRLKAMSPQALMKFLLKDLLRPQAMLPRQLEIKRSDIERR